MAASGQQRSRDDAKDRRGESAPRDHERKPDLASEHPLAQPRALQPLVDPRRNGGTGSALTPPAVLALQTRAGNGAVRALLARRPAIPRARRPAAVRRPAVAKARMVARTAAPAARAPQARATTTAGGSGASSAPAEAFAEEEAGEEITDKAVAGADGVAVQRKTTLGGGGSGPPGAGAGGGAAGGGALPPPPMAPVPKKVAEDPKFSTFTKKAKKAIKQVKKHPTGKVEAQKAQKAAKAPPDDKLAQGKTKQAGEMAAAKPGQFNEESFVKAVLDAVAKATPKNLDEAEKLPSSGKPEQMKAAVAGKVAAGKETATGDVEAKAAAPPSTAGAIEKPVTPLEPTKVHDPTAMKAATAMPSPAPKEQTDFSRGPAEIDQSMAKEGVTKEQLEKSNEPEFTGALEAKKVGEEHSKKAPGEIRKSEAQILKSATKAAGAAEASKVAAVKSAVKKAVGKVSGSKEGAKSKDEQARQKVTNDVNAIYDKTKTDVQGILAGLDDKVDKEFTDGEAKARKNFTEGWKKALKAYKDERYDGISGAAAWGYDLFKGLPSEVNVIYETWKQKYIVEMTGVIRRIGKIVSGELNRAKARIEQGRSELQKYVKGLEPSLQKVGQAAANEIASQFDDLDSSVDDKMNELVDSVAKKYEESQKAVNDEITAAQEANKGLIDKAKDAIGGVIKTIIGLKDMLLNVLRKAADAIDTIIRDPIGFLGRLVDGVKSGVKRFSDNIVDHLKKGLLGWLFGALAGAGIEIPETFDLKGIVKLVLSVLGLTWTNIRGRIVKVIGEKGMTALESGVDIIKKLMTEGPGALWEMLLEKISDFQEMVIGKIRDFVIEKIVKAGITWIISMLNPAAAFIKACKAIYDIVMFFIERGSQIMELVNAITDGIVDVAKGNIGGIAAKVEDALAKALPIAIGFLASLLGLGGISDKIKSIIDTVQKPINRAIDGIINGIVNVTRPIWKFVSDKAGKAKKWATDKANAAKAYANEKINQGKKFIKDKAAGAAGAVTGLFKKQTKPLSMKGTAHTLIANPTPDGAGFKISMRSDERLLSSKIAVAVASLKERAATEDGDAKAATQKQIDQLTFIGKVAADLEKKAAAAGQRQVGPTGAPPGFEAEMADLANLIQEYGTQTGETDIKKAGAGTQVNLELLAKFGLPIASYLQAQKVSDEEGAAIDIRATNEDAPKLLDAGALPKAGHVKTKTVNEEDVALGVPAGLRGKAAWFLPKPLPKEKPAKYSDDDWAKIERRYRERYTEYYDFQKEIGGRLSAGQLMIVGGTDVVSGGVLLDGLKDLAFTGDHDVFAVHPEGKEPTVISRLKPAPFRVQHGAHMSWPKLPKILQRGRMTAKEAKIYNGIIDKHVPGGEALLRINPKAAPTTANSVKPEKLPEEDGGGGGGGGGGPAGGASEVIETTPDFGQPDAGSERSAEAKQADLDAAIASADRLLEDESLDVGAIETELAKLKEKHQLTKLDLTAEDEGEQALLRVDGAVNPTKTTKKYRSLAELCKAEHPYYKYRNTSLKLKKPIAGRSVLTFDSNGFPDFAPFAKVSVKIKMHGNRKVSAPDGDFGNANVAAGYKRTMEHPDHTWHHHQDRQTMLLVPYELHHAIRHYGGVWVIKKLGRRS